MVTVGVKGLTVLRQTTRINIELELAKALDLRRIVWFSPFQGTTRIRIKFLWNKNRRKITAECCAPVWCETCRLWPLVILRGTDEGGAVALLDVAEWSCWTNENETN